MKEDSGAIGVNEYLQVTSHDDVYAIGDVNDVDEESAHIFRWKRGVGRAGELSGFLSLVCFDDMTPLAH